MGINLKDTDWGPTIMEWRESQICRKGGENGTCCKKHKWNLFGGLAIHHQDIPQGNIISTPAADIFIKAHCLKKGPDGKFLLSTARGRRRRNRLESKK